MHRRGDVAEPILRQDHDLNAATFIEGDELSAQLVDLQDVGSGRRRTRPDSLEVVVQVRKIDQRQRRRELLFDVFGGFGNPPGRFDCGLWSPEAEERERAELCLQLVAQAPGRGIDVRNLPAVGGIHRPRRGAEVRGRIHVVPPEQVRARERRIDRSRVLPDLLRLHEPVRLLPELDLRVVVRVPAVADDAVFCGIGASQVIGLRGAGDGGKRGVYPRRRPGGGPARKIRRSGFQHAGRQANDVEDDGARHAFWGLAARRDASDGLQHPIVFAGDRLAEIELEPGRQDVPGVGFDLEMRGKALLLREADHLLDVILRRAKGVVVAREERYVKVDPPVASGML